MRSKSTSSCARTSRTSGSTTVSSPRNAGKRRVSMPPGSAQQATGTTTPLRERMREDLKLAGYAARTQEAYIRAVRMLAQHDGQPPQTLSDQQIRRKSIPAS